jgi:D-lactate dehydrogenase
MKPVRAAFFDAKPYDIKFFDAENASRGFQIKYFMEKLSPDTAPLAAGYDAVCVFVNDDVSAPVLESLHAAGVKLLALRCAGYNNVDLHAAYGKIHVVRVPDYSPFAVAEHAVALMLCLNRKIHRAYYRVRDNNYSINGLLGFDMKGKTAGVVGTGIIGSTLIGILRGFGMTVLAYDPFPKNELADRLSFSYVSFDRLCAESDIISLHCPLNPDTMRLINTDSLAKMKPGVMIINTGRGKLIDTAALVEALKSGAVGSAGLDVYEEESEYFFEDKSDAVMTDDTLARLNTFNNVIVTSHQAFFTREALSNIASTTLKNISVFFPEGALPNEICYRCGKTPCPRKNGGPQSCFRAGPG